MQTQLHIADTPRRLFAFSLLTGIVVVIGCTSGSQNSNSTPVTPVTPVTPATPATYTIGGTISGLSGTGLVLQDNGGNNLSVGAGATSFTFSTVIANGGAYSVNVVSDPTNPLQSCTVTNGSGTVSSTNVTSVAVSCAGTGFALTGSMAAARAWSTATLLNDGQVLIVGGNSLSFELYNPVTGTFNSTGSSIATVTFGQSATLLSNGQVLIAGGYDGTDILASAELYNPATGTFTPTGSMATARELHTATLLNNGQVLIAGGDNGFGYPLSSVQLFSSAELYDPATGTFTATGSMTDSRSHTTATLLNNGKVLIAGGEDNPDGAAVASAELYDPSTGTFTATVNMTDSRAENTETLLNNGQVLIAGGYDSTGITASAELYNPATGVFTPTGSMTTAREIHTATLLNNGQVLMAGGWDGTTDTASAELYDPTTGAFISVGNMTAARQNQTATLLNNGTVLITGGLDFVTASSNPSYYWASAELYNPGIFTPTGLVSIAVTPATPALSVGSTQQFVATGTFSDGSMQNLQSVTWSSSNQAACTITNDASDHGVAFALTVGNCTITASAGSISGSAVLTVQ